MARLTEQRKKRIDTMLKETARFRKVLLDELAESRHRFAVEGVLTKLVQFQDWLTVELTDLNADNDDG